MAVGQQRCKTIRREKSTGSRAKEIGFPLGTVRVYIDTWMTILKIGLGMSLKTKRTGYAPGRYRSGRSLPGLTHGDHHPSKAVSVNRCIETLRIHPAHIRHLVGH